MRPKHIFWVTGIYLTLAWAIVLLVDSWNVLGSRDMIGNAILWPELFANGKPTEWLQWYMLGTAAILSAFLAGRQWDGPSDDLKGQALFWGVLAVGLTLMLVEDAGDVRHEIRRFVEMATGSPRHTGTLDKAVELVYFGLVASVPLFALVRYGKHIRQFPRTFGYVLAGFGFYAIAAVANATRNWGNWYATVGMRAQESLGMIVPDWRDPEMMGHWFIDAVLEETVELLGVTFLLAAAVSFASKSATSTETEP
jgi:hypothetical protein